ncbi:hypothetical protein SteCoe_26362 [Stentor coeruleus]|uniref:THH1/TOM1/TOM3 domain-containing protein n=1 Tax=Stentor coeruleus TaxID=5963 RepID=A0A1R2BCZ5_9CILI|nr:hypothetical protein SteCoe_26362 [Stentor coeruleus]
MDQECLYNSTESKIYAVSALVYLIIWSIWHINSKYLNSQFVNSLHKLLAFTLALKFFLELSSFLVSYTCQNTEMWRYWVLFEGSLFCLYNTSWYMALILISNGFCLTRENFETNEIHTMIISCGAIYIIHSLCLLQESYSEVLLFIMLIVLRRFALSWLEKVKGILKGRINMMERNRLATSLQSTKLKLSMINTFAWLLQFYFAAEILVVGVFLIIEVLKYGLDYITYFKIIDEVIELIGFGATCLIFFPKFRGQYFDLEEYETGHEFREITPMYEANVGEQGLVEDNYEKLPFVLRNPGEDEMNMENPYNNFMIAMPMSLIYYRDVAASERRDQVSDINEPLIPRELDRSS